ncbi:hypothetical protein [Pandoraea norimbergensis]
MSINSCQSMAAAFGASQTSAGIDSIIGLTDSSLTSSTLPRDTAAINA